MLCCNSLFVIFIILFLLCFNILFVVFVILFMPCDNRLFVIFIIILASCCKRLLVVFVILFRSSPCYINPLTSENDPLFDLVLPCWNMDIVQLTRYKHLLYQRPAYCDKHCLALYAYPYEQREVELCYQHTQDRDETLTALYISCRFGSFSF